MNRTQYQSSTLCLLHEKKIRFIGTRIGLFCRCLWIKILKHVSYHLVYVAFISSNQYVYWNCKSNVWKDYLLALTQNYQQYAAPWRRVWESLFEINILPMYFVFNRNSLLLQLVNSDSTHVMCIPCIIFITKKFSFIVRLLHFLCIRNVLKLKYER